MLFGTTDQLSPTRAPDPSYDTEFEPAYLRAAASSSDVGVVVVVVVMAIKSALVKGRRIAAHCTSELRWRRSRRSVSEPAAQTVSLLARRRWE